MSTTDPRPPIAAFWHDLPREGRLLLSVVAFEFIGTGLVIPFWVVYLHEIRGFSLDVVGILLAVMSAAGIASTMPGGLLIDRVGARRTMILVLGLNMAGQTTIAFAEGLPVTTLGIMLIGAGYGLGWPASQALIASVVPSAIRVRYFGVNFTLLNLGVGIGGVIGGFVADVDSVASFQLLYLGDAVSYLPALVLLLWPLRHVGGPAPAVLHTDGGRAVSYLDVFRAPAMASLTILTFVAGFVGYAQLTGGFPAYARTIGEVSTRGLGLAFAANTLVIVLLQLVVLRHIEGHRRTRVIVVMAAVWAACWALLSASGISPGTTTATLLVAASASVFAIGETLMQPTLPAIVNDLAPDHLRGRYNALTSGSFQLASIVGPVVAGFMIGRGAHLEFLVLLIAGCGLVAWLSVLRLEGQLDAVANGVDRAQPETPPT